MTTRCVRDGCPACDHQPLRQAWYIVKAWLTTT